MCSEDTTSNGNPLNFSLCYLYHQLDDETVEVFFRGILEFPIPRARVTDASEFMLEFVLAFTKARECHQMKRISQLINLSKQEREKKM